MRRAAAPCGFRDLWLGAGGLFRVWRGREGMGSFVCGMGGSSPAPLR